MSDFHYVENGTGVEWKHSAHEDKMYVRKYAANYDAVAELAQAVRNDGGTKDMDGFRMVATIPIEVFSAANDGRSHNGRYKGFLQLGAKDQQREFASFFQEEDIKPFMLNDNFRI